MASTLLRFGLWIVLIGLALYVVHETFADAPAAEFISEPMLVKIVIVGVGMVVIGFLIKIFEKAAAKTMKQRCTVCRKPVPHGEIYCRQHLREILEQEHDRRHTIPMTKSRF
jgi:hypothetical protein